MTEINKLDIVLKFMELNSLKNVLSINDISDLLKKDYPEIDFSEDLKLILNKLETDKYINVYRKIKNEDEDLSYSNSEKIYKISFEGKFFSQLGGYAKKKKIDNKNIVIAKVATWAVIVAGIYYFFEVLRLHIIPLLRDLTSSCK